MKRLTLLSVFLLLATAGVFAQSEVTTVTITKDNGNGEKETKTFVERLINDQLYDPLPDLYYSYLDMRDGAFGQQANVPLRSSSFEWGFYSMDQIFCTENGRFGMTSGLGLSNSYNYFTHDQVLKLNEDGVACFQNLLDYSQEDGNGPVSGSAYRTFLRYWSLRLPMMFQFQWIVGNKPVSLALGAEFELRFGVRSFARYGGSKHTISSNLNYEPVGFNALASFRADDAIVFVRFGLTDMLSIIDTNGNKIDACQMAIGFGFNLD